MDVIGRFAPTPSGRMHLGNVLVALLAWLDVRSSGGELVLRWTPSEPAGSLPSSSWTICAGWGWTGTGVV